MKKHRMKVGFYDDEQHRMTDVEPWTQSIVDARLAAAMMAQMYASGSHQLPSPVWCVWDGKKVHSIFLLDEKPRSSRFYDKVMTLMT